jgi:hypothetical protein
MEVHYPVWLLQAGRRAPQRLSARHVTLLFDVGELRFDVRKLRDVQEL